LKEALQKLLQAKSKIFYSDGIKKIVKHWTKSLKTCLTTVLLFCQNFDFYLLYAQELLTFSSQTNKNELHKVALNASLSNESSCYLWYKIEVHVPDL
jgi:hypothetical protein